MPEPDENPFRPPATSLEPPLMLEWRFPTFWYLCFFSAPVVCSTWGEISGERLPIVIGLVIFLPCAILSGFIVAAYLKRIGRRRHGSWGLVLAIFLTLTYFLALQAAYVNAQPIR